MKPLLTTLSILTFATITGNLNNILHTTLQKNNITTNTITAKTQQDTKYIDTFGQEITTNKTNLTNIITKEITQIGFYQNENNEIQVVTMPETIEKVPNQLPSEITSTNFMFINCSIFNQDISQWDTSNITNMSSMFLGATKFNQDLSTWNTANVTNMIFMFYFASSFNNDISTWNTKKVITMFNMFNEGTKFNQDISQWDTSNVIYMVGMFDNAIVFNQNISTWNTANVTDMSYMFNNAHLFNQDLSQWNVEKVINHEDFSTNSGFENDANKLPKFKN